MVTNQEKLHFIVENRSGLPAIYVCWCGNCALRRILNSSSHTILDGTHPSTWTRSIQNSSFGFVQHLLQTCTELFQREVVLSLSLWHLVHCHHLTHLICCILSMFFFVNVEFTCCYFRLRHAGCTNLSCGSVCVHKSAYCGSETELFSAYVLHSAVKPGSYPGSYPRKVQGRRDRNSGLLATTIFPSRAVSQLPDQWHRWPMSESLLLLTQWCLCFRSDNWEHGWECACVFDLGFSHRQIFFDTGVKILTHGPQI